MVMSKNQNYFKSIFPKFVCNMGEWGKVKNFWHTNQHQQYLIAFFLHSNCHSPNPHSCAFSIVTCDRKNEEKMRVGSTNISPNIGYSGRKEPWKEISIQRRGELLDLLLSILWLGSLAHPPHNIMCILYSNITLTL